MENYQARYQAANLSDQESIDSFVVRQKEFHRVIDNIQSSKPGDSMQHYVFVGRRGSGKSTLLRRIQAEINLKNELSNQYVVVNLSEEQTGIYQLYDLWDYVLRDLEQQGISSEEVDWQDYEDDMKAYTHALFNKLQACLKEVDKQLILLVDNIDRIFKAIKNGKGGDSSLLREQLMNHKMVRIIGGSTVMSEDYWKYDMPFYDFFNIKQLKPLSIKEIKELLNHWAEMQENEDIKTLLNRNPGKLQAIRMLTDGTPRTMLLFINMLINRPHQNGYDYLRRIVDDATPIYQERLDQLSTQQQKVLTELSFFWEAVAVEKLISVCKMQSKTLSAQLNQLVKSRLVEKVKGDTKNHTYRLEERFFNLWLLMTQGGPKQKREVKYLTVFLENWYDQDELRSVYNEFVDNLEAGTIKDDYAASMSKALVHSKHISVEERDALIEKAKSLGLKKEWISELPETSIEIYGKVVQLFQKYKYGKAEDLLLSVEQDDGLKWFALGLTCYFQKKQTEAEKYYQKAVEQNFPEAMNSLGNLYWEQEKWEEAERSYLMAIEEKHADAMNNLASLYRQQESFQQAEKYYLMAVEKDNLDAIKNLADLYKEQKKYDLAEKYYLMAIAENDANAMNNLANTYRAQGKWNEAEKYYLMAVAKDHSYALNNLVWYYYASNINTNKVQKWFSSFIEGTKDDLKAKQMSTFIALWIGDVEQFDESKSAIEILMSEEGISSFDVGLLSDMLIEWLIHKQYHSVLNLLEKHNELKEQILPLYYATLHFVDGKEKILRNMPPEFEENVNDILSDIRERQEFYYGTKK